MNTRTEQLVNDIKTAATHAEELIESTRTDVSGRAKEVRARLSRAVESAKSSLDELQAKAAATAKKADATIRSHPYKSLGIAAAVGFVLGLLIIRRD